MRFSIKTFWVVSLLVILLGCSKEHERTGIEIGNYTYSFGYDDEQNVSVVNFSLYVHNRTANSIVLKSVKPRFRKELSNSIVGEDYIDCHSSSLLSGEGLKLKGSVYFDVGKDKSIWVETEEDFKGFIVDAEVIVE